MLKQIAPKGIRKGLVWHCPEMIRDGLNTYRIATKQESNKPIIIIDPESGSLFLYLGLEGGKIIIAISLTPHPIIP